MLEQDNESAGNDDTPRWQAARAVRRGYCRHL